MKIVFFTFYFPPDLSAGSFRAQALVEALLGKMGADDQLEVVTTTPNRYAGMEITDQRETPDSRLSVKRIPVPAHQSGIADQVRSFTAFARGALTCTRRSRPDLVIGTSSRLFTATLSAVAGRRARIPLYLDIRDIFSETIENVFANSPVRYALPVLRPLEAWTLRSARRVNVVSPAFVPYFAPVVGEERLTVHSNGVDPMFVDFARNHPVPATRKARPRVLAAGNIGEGQGLHRIVPGLAAAHPEVDFRIIGGGGRRAMLEQAVAASGVTNVAILDPVARHRLGEEYASADVLFLHLNDLDGFERVIPSKMFEYAATGRAILAGVRGKAREMIAPLAGSAVFPPCDVTKGAAALAQLLESPRVYDRTEFVARYDRRRIMDAMADDILALASERHLVA